MNDKKEITIADLIERIGNGIKRHQEDLETMYSKIGMRLTDGYENDALDIAKDAKGIRVSINTLRSLITQIEAWSK